MITPYIVDKSEEKEKKQGLTITEIINMSQDINSDWLERDVGEENIWIMKFVKT